MSAPDRLLAPLLLAASVGCTCPSRPTMTTPDASSPDAAVTTAAATPAPTRAELETSTREWHAKRLERLTSESGWLTLVALGWLEPGDNPAGSAEDAAIRLPASSPANLGNFTLDGDTVRFTPAAGVEVTLDGKPFTGGAVRTDAQGGPDELRSGSLQLLPIRRGERTAIRVRDSEAPARKAFQGIPTWPVDPKWRVEGRLERPASPRTIAIPNVLGQVEQVESPGVVHFTLEGQALTLEPVLEGDELFLIFADASNRDASYPAGRFLYAAAPGADGRVVLDFNRAYNPPCAFSPHATCPLPPKQNRLPVRIEAGEQRAGAH